MHRTKDRNKGQLDTSGSVNLMKDYISVNILTTVVILSLGFRMLSKREGGR